MSDTPNTLALSTADFAEAPPEALQVANQLATNIAATLRSQTINNATFVTLPEGYTLMDISADIEKQNPARLRKMGAVSLGDVASLLAYCADQADQATGYIYADPDTRSITAVFNDQRALGNAGWRDHRAHFVAQFTPEFNKWMSNNNKKFEQNDFAEFIEDNFTDIGGEDAQKLLNVATTIQATTGINFSSARRLQDGQTQFTYSENIDAKAGADGSLSIPKTFTLGLRIFKNGDGYKLTARLKYRLSSGRVNFFYELERPERAVEDAFAAYVETVRAQSGYTVLIGKA